jgi:hypothetical protein
MEELANLTEMLVELTELAKKKKKKNCSETLGLPFLKWYWLLATAKNRMYKAKNRIPSG